MALPRQNIQPIVPRPGMPNVQPGGGGMMYAGGTPGFYNRPENQGQAWNPSGGNKGGGMGPGGGGGWNMGNQPNINVQGGGFAQPVGGSPSQPSLTPQGPPTGLIGSESALLGGLEGALGGLSGGLNQGRNDIMRRLGMGNQGILDMMGQGQRGIMDMYGRGAGNINSMLQQGTGPLRQFVGAGQQSQQQQAALSGAMGPEAQRAAFAAYQDSPGQDWLREKGERAVTRNASAMGGLGGGRVMQELQRQGIGLASQQYGEDFNRLGSITDQGLTAAGQMGGLYGQAGGQLANLAGQAGSNLGSLGGIGMGNMANLAGVGAGQLGNLGQVGGVTASNLFRGTGQDLASGRTQAGRDIAGAVSGTSGSLADLINQQGSGISDLTGQGGTNIANLLSGLGTLEGADINALMTLLGNISTGSASQNAALPSIPGIGNTPGGIGDIASLIGAIGTAYSAFK